MIFDMCISLEVVLVFLVSAHTLNIISNTSLLYGTFKNNKCCIVGWLVYSAILMAFFPVPIIWAAYLGLQVGRTVKQ